MSSLFPPSTADGISATLLIHNDATTTEWDHIRLGKALWESLAITAEETEIAVSVRPSKRPLAESAGKPENVVYRATLDLSLPPGDFAGNLAADSNTSSYAISRTAPPILSDVFLVALSPWSYQLAADTPDYLPTQLTNKILRQGTRITFPSSEDAYIVLMTEPTVQGLVKEGVTNITVVPPQETDEEAGDGAEANGLEIEGDDEGSLDQDLTIDESFLASSVLLPHTSISPALSPVLSGSPRPSDDHSGPSLTLASLAGSPNSGEDEDSTIYVRTKELGRIGVFSGDWAIASSTSSNHSRLVKLVGEDTLASSDAKTSPTLLHNLSPKIHLTPSPHTLIPTATSTTIASIASALSTDKRYQGACLKALKEYFEKAQRLVKIGDAIAVPVSITGGETGDEVLDVELPLTSCYKPSAAVYFKITHIDYDFSSNPLQHHDAVTLGELGCRIDPNVTKMIQTGVEHSRVPDVAAYLHLDLRRVSETSSPYLKLHSILTATLHPSSIAYDLPISVLLKGSRGIGKRALTYYCAMKLGIHVYEVNCYDIVGETDVKTEGTLRARIERAGACTPCVMLLRNIDALAKTGQALETGREPPIIPVLHECMDELRRAWRENGFPAVLVATTADAEHVPVAVLGCFKHEIALEVPNEPERLEILTTLLEGNPLAPDVSVRSVATQTAALVAADLVDLVERAKMASLERSTISNDVTSVMTAGIQLTGADFDSALSKARASYSESIGAPTIPNVTWDDVGGLANVKQDILDTIQLPLEHPELFADGMKKRSGILLYGPPGTGKTLLAKAVATSCSLNFFSVKGPELLNMYIGESEANVRRVFQRARDAKPCVIFFDELDSVAPKRGNHGDSGGVMDRIVSQLLAELDGMGEGGSGGDVFVIGATNRPDLLDPALLRPGRFDRMLYLGVSDTHEAQLNIIQALTRKFRLDPELDLRTDVAEKCPFNYTGADFYALCSDAMLKAMARKAQEVDAKIAELNTQPPPYSHPHPLTPQYYLAEMATDSEIDVLVSRTDFDAALRELVPSVSANEMQHYAEVQKKFAKETINNAQTPQEGPSVDIKGKGKARAE